jgi:alpha-tubulin suppressor-like RCC1 family protein
MPSPEITTNYRTSDGADLGNKLVSKDYLISVYPQIANQIITPELWVWGATSNGGLGNFIGSTTGARCTPVTTLAGGANWKEVSSGYRIMAAIKNDGTLWTWGRNSNGQLGDNTTTTRSTPVTTFVGGNNWKQVSCGNNHIAAIKTDGTLWGWGFNGDGEMGDNTGTDRLTPVTTFSGGIDWKQVSCGKFSTAAIKTNGTLWTWGLNGYGQLGINILNSRITPVTTFAGGNNWKQVSNSGNHMAAIKTDGTLWTWGNNQQGQLGINVVTIINARCTPVTTFVGGTNWKQVSCGSASILSASCAAIKTDGTLWTWGDNSFGSGQLGTNNSITRSTPVTTFAGGTNWKQVSCGGYHMAAIKTDGTLWSWGLNTSGEIGINVQTSTSGRSTPVTTFAGGTNWKQVSCGYKITAVIRTSDDLQGI